MDRVECVEAPAWQRRDNGLGNERFAATWSYSGNDPKVAIVEAEEDDAH
jgi:hypothetical protein